MGLRRSSCSSNDSVECKAEDKEEKDIGRAKPAGIECPKYVNVSSQYTCHALDTLTHAHSNSILSGISDFLDEYSRVKVLSFKYHRVKDLSLFRLRFACCFLQAAQHMLTQQLFLHIYVPR